MGKETASILAARGARLSEDGARFARNDAVTTLGKEKANVRVALWTQDGSRYALTAEGVAENFEGSMRFATSETTGHIGALLMLMAMSMGAAGIIERSGVLEALPETFGSIWIAAR